MKRPAFTLLEILISSVIFLVAIVVAMSAFSATAGSRSRTEDVQIVTQASKFSLETVAIDARRANAVVSKNGQIIPGLAIVDSSGDLVEDDADHIEDGIVHGQRLYVAFDPTVESNNFIYYVDQNILKKKAANAADNTGVALTPTDLKVDNLFLVGSVPPEGVNCVTTQPYVEMRLTIEPSKTANDANFTITSLRTTVTSSQYTIKQSGSC